MPAVATQVLQAITLDPAFDKISENTAKMDRTSSPRSSVWVRAGREGREFLFIGKIIANEGKRFQAYGLRDGKDIPLYCNDMENLIFLGDCESKNEARAVIVQRAIEYREAVLRAKNASSGDTQTVIDVWREIVKKFSHDPNVVTAISAQFVGPILKILEEVAGFATREIGGIHFIGSKGNTKPVQDLSSSIWGESYSFSWSDFIAHKGKKNKYDNDHSTAFIEEAMSYASYTGGVIHSGEDAGVHMSSDMWSIVSNGGFNRTDRAYNLIAAITYKVFIVSFGLKSPTQQDVDLGKTLIYGGIMHRILSIPATVRHDVDPDLRQRLMLCDGVPGQMFVDRLHDVVRDMPDFMSKESVRSRISEMCSVLESALFVRPDTKGVQSDGRVHNRLAAISLAGEMAYHLGVSPFPPSMVTSSVLACAIKALSDMDQNMPASSHYPESVPLSQRSSAPSKRKK